MPLFIILDNSIYSVIRLVLGPEKVTAQNMGTLVNALINRDNATYKNYKLYIDRTRLQSIFRLRIHVW